MKTIECRARQVCSDLQAKGNYRQIRYPGANARLNLASNDYLGVVKNGRLKASLAKHAALCGTGGASSRLVFGSTKHHRLLEEKLAECYGYEAALVFSSGFMANYGLCSALKELADVVLIDKRVHASVVDGLMQSMGGKPEIRSFSHNDPGHYRQLAEKSGCDGQVTITESVFSMTGSVCRDEIITEAASRGFVVVDEAHSIGAVKPGGRPMFGRARGVDVTVGTFGKALGCSGGFILCSEDMRAFLLNRCRSFIFTTALPEVYAAVGADAIDLVAGMDEERGRLAELAWSLFHRLESAGFRVSGGAHIIAIYCSGSEEAVELSQLLAERGIMLYAVRPPTVPPREVMLRVSVNAALTRADLDFFLEELQEISTRSPHLFASPYRSGLSG